MSGKSHKLLQLQLKLETIVLYDNDLTIMYLRKNYILTSCTEAKLRVGNCTTLRKGYSHKEREKVVTCNKSRNYDVNMC